MKKVKDLFSILIVILTGFLVWSFYSYNQQETKFAAQKLGVSVSDFEEVWGKPDDVGENGAVLFYKCKNGLGHRYVFRFDENNRLKGKYFDD